MSKLDAEKFSNNEVKKLVERYFGNGSSQAVLKAFEKRGLGTVLYNGGGEILPIPLKEQKDKTRATWESLTPTKDIPCVFDKCMECGEDLIPELEYHYLPVSERIEKAEDCNRFTNNQIVRVIGHEIRDSKDLWPYIKAFQTWDGESYRDDFFCSVRCAASYGRKSAKQHRDMQK